MSEPHQRSQSGKLRNTSKTIRTSFNRKQEEKVEQKPGIENATQLYFSEPDDTTENYYQTPDLLTDIHVSILKKIAEGFSIIDSDAIDKYWRKTWNIGRWLISNKLCISFNIMQPNISSSWVHIENKHISSSTIEHYASHFRSLNLPHSTCAVSGSKTLSLQGRWSLTVLQKLIDDKHITLDQARISSLNIAQSKLFCWIKMNTESEYLCTLTSSSVDILCWYLPDWCSAVESGGSTSLVLKGPTIVNDCLPLIIDTYGYIRYNGKPENIVQVTKALSMAISSLINSRRLKIFLESLEYKKI